MDEQQLDNREGFGARADAPGPIKSPVRASIGRVVLYRSRTGSYTVPAIITATVDTLNPDGVEYANVPHLDSADHVHLTVLTPATNVAGCYQEWNIPFGGAAPLDGDYSQQAPATWGWPSRI